MNQFEWNEVLNETILNPNFAIILMFWNGLLVLVLGLRRIRKGKNLIWPGLLVTAALLDWGLILMLTTTVFGTKEIIPVDLIDIVKTGLPYFITLIIAGMIAISIKLLPKNRPLFSSVSLFLFIILPIIQGLQTMKEKDHRKLCRELAALTVDSLSVQVPSEPIVDANHPGMILIPAGPFVRGSLSSLELQPQKRQHDGNEQPVRTIYLDAFYIDRTEVTNQDFGGFVRATNYVTDAERFGGGIVWDKDGQHFQPGAQWRHTAGPPDSIEGQEDHPVGQVSWYDAKAFCDWIGKRLPTEAEWEKAARGNDARIFPWGNDFDPHRVNYRDASIQTIANKDLEGFDGFPRTAPVGSFPTGASPYGVLDMAGNVWEWVNDWYQPDYYEYSPRENPRGDTQRPSAYKVVRGGSWTSAIGVLRTSARSYDPPRTYRSLGVGFRCAQSLSITVSRTNG